VIDLFSSPGFGKTVNVEDQSSLNLILGQRVFCVVIIMFIININYNTNSQILISIIYFWDHFKLAMYITDTYNELTGWYTIN